MRNHIFCITGLHRKISNRKILHKLVN
nr:ribosomal protein S15 [Juncus himalensis]ULQ66974.1 ribosomal protein S15 [Juncus himalensis]